MAHNYLSDEERHSLEQAKKDKAALDQSIAANNASLVGEPKEYKGVTYQMRQNGLYVCLNIPTTSPLAGAFTSAGAIHKLVDELERQLRATN